MTPDGDRDELAEVVALERQLLDGTFRAASDQVARLLHHDFVEVGASGRVWDRASIVAALAADPEVGGRASDFLAARLADDVILLTYRVSGTPSTLRASVWVQEDKCPPASRSGNETQTLSTARTDHDHHRWGSADRGHVDRLDTTLDALGPGSTNEGTGPALWRAAACRRPIGYARGPTATRAATSGLDKLETSKALRR